jgi:hypothetical protein
VHELDAVLASVVLDRVAEVAPVEVTQVLAERSTKVDHHRPVEATAEQRVAFLQAVLDFDDWCGTPWPRRPWPGPRRFGDLADPIAGMVLAKAAETFHAAGSPALQETLGDTVAELARRVA